MSLNSKRKKKNTTVRTISESNIKILKRGKINTPKKNTLPLTFLAWYRHFNKNNVAVFN